MDLVTMASSSAVPQAAASSAGASIGEGMQFKLSKTSQGMAGILPSTGVVLTPSDFDALKDKIATFSSFNDLADNFPDRVLSRGTMIIHSATVAEEPKSEKRDAAIAACGPINDLPTSALTTGMLEAAFSKVTAYETELKKRSRTSPDGEVGDALHRMEREFAEHLGKKHAVKINVKSLTGEFFAKSRRAMVDLLKPKGGPKLQKICKQICSLALRPERSMFQYECLRTMLDKIDRPDLVDSILSLRDPRTDVSLRIPLGCAKTATPGVRMSKINSCAEFRSARSRGYYDEIEPKGKDDKIIRDEDGAVLYDSLSTESTENDVDLWVDICSVASRYGWTQRIGCDPPLYWNWDDRDFTRDDTVRRCPADSAALLFNTDSACVANFFPPKFCTRVLFASEAECARVLKTIQDIQTVFTSEEEIVKASVERCPEYSKTQQILRAPYEKLAFALDNGDKSWELYRDTTLFKTVDWVNSESYRSYHEVEGEEVLYYDVFATVKEQAEDSSESGQEDEYDYEDQSDDEE